MWKLVTLLSLYGVGSMHLLSKKTEEQTKAQEFFRRQHRWALSQISLTPQASCEFIAEDLATFPAGDNQFDVISMFHVPFISRSGGKSEVQNATAIRRGIQNVLTRVKNGGSIWFMPSDTHHNQVMSPLHAFARIARR
jgi:hypothetical protein